MVAEVSVHGGLADGFGPVDGRLVMIRVLNGAGH